MALIAKNKFGLVDGSIKQPVTEDPAYGGWIRCNTMMIFGSWTMFQRKSCQVYYTLILLKLCREICKEGSLNEIAQECTSDGRPLLSTEGNLNVK